MDNNNQADRRSQIASLLALTGEEHGKYEASKLGGQYDVDWPKWYAGYLVEHGLPDLLRRKAKVESDQIEELLRKADASHRENAPDERWADYYAQYLLENI